MTLLQRGSISGWEVAMRECCDVTDVVGRSTRGEFVRRGAVGGSAIFAGGALLAWLPATADAKPSAAQDKKIFAFALQLEYLQTAFYTTAVNDGALRGEVLEFAETVAAHEQQHVDFLVNALGSAAGAKPEFDFGQRTRSTRAFLDAAVLLENGGVEAYNGQAANLTRPSLALAAQIVSVEARHAAWVSILAGDEPAPRPADPGASAAEIAASIEHLGFVQ
jgi:rubrerythrin